MKFLTTITNVYDFVSNRKLVYSFYIFTNTHLVSYCVKTKNVVRYVSSNC